MDLTRLPFFDRLANARNVLIAGAGGGFDVFTGLPLYLTLADKGVKVHLANLSFSDLDEVQGRRVAPGVVEVGPESPGPRSYFPEKHLARWLEAHHYDPRVHAFHKTGVAPLKRAYEAVVADLGIDAIVLVDGGTDSLLRGDEAGLGTPSEDMASIAAVDALDLPTKLLVSIGFGVDAFHGVSHALVLENIAALTADGGFLGGFSLLPGMPEFALYRSAVDFVNSAMPTQPSIVNTSIISAAEGAFGDVHRTPRTRGSTLFINPLMAMYFAFDLRALAARVLYLPHLAATETMFQVSAIIERAQYDTKTRPRTPIPI